MTPKAFKRWRKACHLSQKDAADALGLKTRMIQYYENGERDGKKVKVPKTVRLACFALSRGVADYDGKVENPVPSSGEQAVESPRKL